MPKYFMQGTRLESFEKMMMEVPRHLAPDQGDEPYHSYGKQDYQKPEEGDNDHQSGTE